eukprot:10712397-Alexandrium_andersonii.AAC.1
MEHAAGLGRAAQEEAQRRHEQEGMIAKFDPAALGVSLRSGLFYHYVTMCLYLEQVPPQLAGYAEACPCHEPMIRGLREHDRGRVMSAQYSQGIHSCPCAGMMGPEL